LVVAEVLVVARRAGLEAAAAETAHLVLALVETGR